MATILFIVPLTLLIAGSLTAYIVYWLCDRGFRRAQSISSRD